MIQIFHGDNEATHDAFQAWRQANVDGFHLAEGPLAHFRMHWTQDKRESEVGRGCAHQGGSRNPYRADRCYTKARKVCSTSAQELRAWVKLNGATVKSCAHCDTARFPFPSGTLADGETSGDGTTGGPDASPAQSALEGRQHEYSAISRSRNGALRLAALQAAKGTCAVCAMDFSSVLGGIGSAVLEVHHRKQLSSYDVPTVTSIDDLAVVCSNCHALIHSDAKTAFTVEALRALLSGESKRVV